jgi:hypothetical protein
MRGEEARAQGFERIERQPVAERVGQGAEDGPILARLAGREIGPVRQLDAAFGIP